MKFRIQQNELIVLNNLFIVIYTHKWLSFKNPEGWYYYRIHI